MSTPSSAASGDSVARQLELFPSDSEQREPPPLRLARATARACVSPAWWPHIAPLWESADIVVTVCREVDSALCLEATSREDEGWLQLLLARIRASVERTCGCCGAAPSGLFRANLDGPTRRVCVRCRTRLLAGDSHLAIADEHFRLDGSRRIPPLFSVKTRKATTASNPAATRRTCETLPPDELRRLIVEIRDDMRAEICGHDEALAELALIAACHVGGGLARGARALLIGPSGVGKSEMVRSMARQLVRWDLPPVVHCDVVELVSAGWQGSSLGDLISSALGYDPVDSDRAQRLVIVLDELHHAAIDPQTHGNSLQKQKELLASFLSLGHGTTVLPDGRVWSSQRALVLGVGAFTGLLPRFDRPPTIAELARCGIPVELSTRLAESVILLRPLPERDLVGLLRRWPALTSLITLCERLGFAVQIPNETYHRAARVVKLGHDDSTPRTAGGWLVTALRRSLIQALAADNHTELVVAPDSLPIPITATRPQPPDEPSGPGGPWDTTIVLRPR